MRLLLRADASGSIGVGHLARAVAFAEEAVARGWQVSLSGRTDNAEWLALRMAELGVHRREPADDAASIGVLAREADVVLVDNYQLGEVRDEVNAAGATLVSMESRSFGRRAADVVVDSGLEPLPRPDDGSRRRLAGPEFAPLRQDVRLARAHRGERREHPERPRVVVVLGGGALWREIVTTLVTALRDTGVPCQVDVLAHGGPELPSAGTDQEFRLCPPDTRLPSRLADADLAVSAAGVTLLELCCIGVPAAVVQLVDNQAAGYRAAVRRELVVGLGTAAMLDDGAVETLRTLLSEPRARERLAARSRQVVDGEGAARVLDAVLESA
ncbi:Spore coat polysaccharide biosynthesis protein SpsG, predicted glycosyltransferase [Amycolatopsis marina]|uniref:Spore coat polysaccharide biosynthesis protein SpsG, predicted glycosyltransferase n=1 Tax=Amycolatopsis marina TaxID=490629 RepID=A0A1I0XNQ7_9PSEU|nr:spore coat protein [Amycolatopsis marina]SFB01593.1 Spore coat polysaccharide biosynthesis protein SpsG, predicted glycosyltransferase [Amycolatopsis marina]